MPTYHEGYADARSEMDQDLDYVHFHHVFASSRFLNPDSMKAARHMVDAAVNILRVYRGREVQLEQTYHPDAPDDAGSLREPFLAAEASRMLLDSVDSLFGLLVAQEGGVVARGPGLKFMNPAAGAEYTVLRNRIRAQIARWRDSAEAPNRVTMPRLLRALEDGPPPPVH